MSAHNSSITKPKPRLWNGSSFLFISLVFFFGLILFSVNRLYFLSKLPVSVLDTTTAILIKQLLIGLRYDIVVLGILLAPVIVILPWLRTNKKHVRVSVLTYLSTVFSFVQIAWLSDIRYYSYFSNHLDFRVVEYFNQGDTFWNLISVDSSMVTYVIFWVVGTVLLILFLAWLFRLSALYDRKIKFIYYLGLYTLMIAVTALGIRGRLNRSPLRWSQAYTTNNHHLNQLPLNGIFTLAKAISAEGNDPRLSYLDESYRFPFLPTDEAIDSVQKWYAEPSSTYSDSLLPIARIKKQPVSNFGFQPNIILIIMESFSARNCSSINPQNKLTPEFDRLAERGILFDNFFASGTRTSYGLAATICGYPSLPGRSILSRYNARRPFKSLSRILGERGYFNIFAYGGDLVFDNMEGFFRREGYDRFISEDQFALEDQFAKWGVPDHLLFNRLISELDSISRPFNLTVLTLSNHEPFDLPDSSVQLFDDNSETSRERNAQRYADDALGKFVRQLERKNILDSSILIAVADHARWGEADAMINPFNFQIPLLIYSPALLGDSARRFSGIGGQCDIIPTIMGILGGDYRLTAFGRDLLHINDKDSSFTMMNVLNWSGISLDGRLWYVENVGLEQQLYQYDSLGAPVKVVTSEFPNEFKTLQRRLRILMQVAEQLSTHKSP